MKSISAIVLALVTAAASAPLVSRQTQTYYRLKTQLIRGNSDKDNLYVQAYHTGAGLNDPVLVPATNSPDEDYYALGFLNGTAWQFALGSNFPYGFGTTYDTNYAGWEPLTIDAGYGVDGFYFNSSYAPGLLFNAGSNVSSDRSEFLDWLACDWVHGAPQLFWHSRFNNFSYPDSCSEVWLDLEEATETPDGNCV